MRRMRLTKQGKHERGMMDRYRIEVGYSTRNDNSFIDENTDKNGEWVKYEDAQSELTALTAQFAEAKAEISELLHRQHENIIEASEEAIIGAELILEQAQKHHEIESLQAQLASLQAENKRLVEKVECPKDCWLKNHSYPLMDGCDICCRKQNRPDKYQQSLPKPGEVGR